MPLTLQDDCSFFGPALPEPFILGDLEPQLNAAKLLPKATGPEGKKLAGVWNCVRRTLRALGEVGGSQRVANHVLKPLVEALGYGALERQEEAVRTREGDEDAGWLFTGKDGAKLRAWAFDVGADLDAPSRRGHAYRFSPSRIANRVLLTKGERLGLLTDGTELRLLVCDPARSESHIVINIARGGWRSRREPPDSFRLLLALGSPQGVRKLPDLTEAARLSQTKVTAKLREQAKRAVLGFLQAIFEDPKNQGVLKPGDADAYPELARKLWAEGLVVVYRLLFVLKLESSPDPARAFSFASNSLWRNTYSPNFALGRIVEDYSRKGIPTGTMLSDGLRVLFAMFRDGLSASGLKVNPLGGMLFGKDSTPQLDQCAWSEEAVRCLLENLLWTPRDGRDQPQRVHYGSLDVEDLGRVYEALLELEPGIATEPMWRLRRAKLEVVVPAAQGEPYRKNKAADADEDDAGDDADADNGDENGRGKKTKVQWIEEIRPGSFYLRVGLGRKASSSYYTPDAFVRFLVQETLEPQAAERSPKDDPNPGAILKLKVLDPAMGSGHFLVGACRFLADKLYEACRLCDELASKAEEQAERQNSEKKGGELRARAAELKKRVEDLPDPNDELVAYLPSHVPEGEQSGVSQAKAMAICRRLVAVHCLYGVDKNPLAVELAKVALWLESYAEGLPLTFVDHRLVCGDSLTGPFVADLLTFPGTGERIDDLLAKGLARRLKDGVERALRHVAVLDSSVGKDAADIEAKRTAKWRLDEELAPFKMLAAAWSGGVQLGTDKCDDQAYLALARAVATSTTMGQMPQSTSTAEMLEAGQATVPYDLAFPEVFHQRNDQSPAGFHAVIGNPPWDTIQYKSLEFLAAFDLSVLDAPSAKEREATVEELLSDPAICQLAENHQEQFERLKRSNDRLYQFQKVTVDGDLAGRFLDAFRVFLERNAQLLALNGFTGVLVPSSFHANEGATGVRQLYLRRLETQSCYSFENRKKLFDIDSRFKFATVVAKNSSVGTAKLRCAFYLHALDWLFADEKLPAALEYPIEFITQADPACLTLLELRNEEDFSVYRKCVAGRRLADWRKRHDAEFSTSEMNLTKDSWRFSRSQAKLLVVPAEKRLHFFSKIAELPLYEGKTVHQYAPCFGDLPRWSLPLVKLIDRPYWFEAARHYRLAYRKIARATDERAAIWVLLPPGAVTAESCPSERVPLCRPQSEALVLLAVMNSFVADFLLGRRLTATVNLFILDATPLPELEEQQRRFLVHEALRLTCCDATYVPLWAEQVRTEWREPTSSSRFPVLANEKDRWAVRAAIDAVVAHAYGLGRGQYEHVLRSFSHKSYPDAPKLCLEAFDEFKKIGLKAFVKKHDPYWDVPLNENLPTPVVDLPIPGENATKGQGLLPGMKAAANSSRPRKRT